MGGDGEGESPDGHSAKHGALERIVQMGGGDLRYWNVREAGTSKRERKKARCVGHKCNVTRCDVHLCLIAFNKYYTDIQTKGMQGLSYSNNAPNAALTSFLCPISHSSSYIRKKKKRKVPSIINIVIHT